MYRRAIGWPSVALQGGRWGRERRRQAQGCVLGPVNRFAYAELPDEVMLD
jgi:hypothetical protein